MENVNVVFHCAANVRFDQPLRQAVEMNTVGTHRALQLAEGIKNLKVFVHVSTSYCHCNEDVLEEHAYPSPHNPIGIIHMIRSLNDGLLEQITPKYYHFLLSICDICEGRIFSENSRN